MDYFKIGQRIRKYRKAHNLSQEQLAEQVGISVTHMSHIETGNTKLSLQVLVDLARVLEVQADDLLGENVPDRKIVVNELSEILDCCTVQQLRIITDVAKATKLALVKHSSN